MKVLPHNQGLIRNYLNYLLRHTLQELGNSKSILTQQQIKSSIIETIHSPNLPSRQRVKTLKKQKIATNKENKMCTSNTFESALSRTFGSVSGQQQQLDKGGKEIMDVMLRNQETIIGQMEEISYMKRERNLQYQITRALLKQWKKDQLEDNFQATTYAGDKLRRRNCLIGGHHPEIVRSSKPSNLSKFKGQPQEYHPHQELTKSLVNTKFYTHQKREGSADVKLQKNSISQIQISDFNSGNQNISKNCRRTHCLTERTGLNTSRFASSQFAKSIEYDQSQNFKALKKLRKLQKFVFQQSSRVESKALKRKNSRQQFFNLTQSPSKQYYKQENNNLKAIQKNLNTHLQLLQKFREVPCLESMVAREETIKRKEQNLSQLEDNLRKREMTLNVQQAGIIKKQRSFKGL